MHKRATGAEGSGTHLHGCTSSLSPPGHPLQAVLHSQLLVISSLQSRDHTQTRHGNTLQGSQLHLITVSQVCANVIVAYGQNHLCTVCNPASVSRGVSGLLSHDQSHTRHALCDCVFQCTDSALGIVCLIAEPRCGVPASSSLVYLTKSFFRTRIRMVARKPVNSSTVTQLLMIENQ